MAQATWNYPTRILFGEGAVRDVGPELKNLGAKHALIVTDPGVNRAGLVEPVRDALNAAGIESTVFDAISTNPSEAEAKAATDAYRKVNADAVVAVGGGAALDVGKMVRILATEPLPLAEYDDAIGGDAKMKAQFPPMIAVPTTAGTGSEVGRSAVVTLAATGKKHIFFHPKLIANVAVLDPTLTTSMPAKITAATGFDALTHSIEAFLANGDHPIADAIAIKSITFVARYLEKAVKSPMDLEARGFMLKAAMMGAAAFQKGLGVCHSLAHPLGAEHDLHHGLANALCLPAVMDFNRQAVPAKVAEVGRALGVSGASDEAVAAATAEAVRKLRRDVGLPEGLAAVGINESHLAKLSQLAFEDGCHGSNPRKCTVDDLASLYRVSL
jgi:4-hydroxybutyrate dehydrogenase